MKLTLEEVFELIKKERARQDAKWGPLEDRNQSLAGFLLVIEAELKEAKDGWLKNVPDEHSSLSELVQVAAAAIACIQKHGSVGNPR